VTTVTELSDKDYGRTCGVKDPLEIPGGSPQLRNKVLFVFLKKGTKINTL
jgi:hypothetical protein